MAAALQLTVEAQHGVGRDHQWWLTKMDLGEAVQEGGEQRMVWPGEFWFVGLSLQHGQLMA
ncbi:hypothetical protein SBI_09870 [Streptomyces bingchenggensis BCW-1]|uniref:Uncharacterized protein n=1 Tax=Streptomyces bingchenggensis (strain BCW-1) TaxID=749414 RepID=D7CDE6_STRBB|nr:hypothetical protein SBI_09870 [Streptomyces bingchenggensis BCW-1]